MKIRLIIFLILLMTAQGYSEPIRVMLKKNADIKVSDIFLRDIASIFGKDKKTVAKLSSVFIKSCPENEKTVTVNRFEVERRLKTSGVNLQDIQFSGMMSTTVEIVSGLQVTNPLKAAVSSYVKDYYSNQDVELKIDFKHLPSISKDDAVSSSFKVIPASNQGYENKVVFVVGAYRAKTLNKKYPVSVDISIYRNVLIASRKIDRQENLLPQDFITMKREVSDMRHEPVLSFDELQGNRAAKQILQGKVLTRNRLEPIPAVQQGDVVTITTSDNTFSITTLGRARKSGGVGEIIPVVNLNSRRQINARIIDNSTVMVDFQN